MGMPKLSDLRESGSIEQDADVVLFIHRPNKDSENINERSLAQIVIAKQRNGPIGQVQLYFNEQYVSFSNLDTTWGRETEQVF
jgi:replicative DNA helicase